jgi:DNA-binding transcriptional ArsR family regulator
MRFTAYGKDTRREAHATHTRRKTMPEPNMTILAKILSSRVRAEIFRLLFGLTDKEMHLREIIRQAGLNLQTVRQDLNKLLKLDLVVARRDGNRLYYRANQEHPLYPEIHLLVLKTAGLVEVLQRVLKREGVKVAFIFGSVAIGQEKAGSDVDLMVIGEVSLRTVTGWLAGVSLEIGREVNPYVMNVAEFQKRREAEEHFLSQVLDSPKLFIIGKEDDLAAMGG